MKIDNAIIMAAGMSTRFVPLSFETHKAMIKVNNEILIERQIKQLIEKGIKDIFVVTGYMPEQFEFLKDKYNVKLVHNGEYTYRNNNSSIWAVKDVLSNSYVCSSDNYFSINPFENEVSESYYAVLFSKGHTNEWCVTEDEYGYIDCVTIGGSDSWYMLGHTFWSCDFAKKFIDILYKEYDLPETKNKLWEAIYLEHLDILKMKAKKYAINEIYEFDTLDELRTFDKTYIDNSGSPILKEISSKLRVNEKEIYNFKPMINNSNKLIGFTFCVLGKTYLFDYFNKILEEGNK